MEIREANHFTYHVPILSYSEVENKYTFPMVEMPMGRYYINILGFHHISHRNQHGPFKDQGNHKLSATSECQVTPKLLRSCQLLSQVCPTTRNHHTVVAPLTKEGHTILLVHDLPREFSTNQTNHSRSGPISISRLCQDIPPTNRRVKYRNW